MIYLVITTTHEGNVYIKAFTNEKDSKKYYNKELEENEKQVARIGLHDRIDYRVYAWKNTKKGFCQSINSNPFGLYKPSKEQKS